MPTITQTIRTYEVLFSHNVSGNPPRHSQTPFLHLRFDAPTAKDNLLILSFVLEEASLFTGDVTRLANGSYRLSARVLVGRLPTYIDLLRNEKPVSLRADYAAEPVAGQTVPLSNFVLFTGPEPPGEGPGEP